MQTTLRWLDDNTGISRTPSLRVTSELRRIAVSSPVQQLDVNLLAAMASIPVLISTLSGSAAPCFAGRLSAPQTADCEIGCQDLAATERSAQNPSDSPAGSAVQRSARSGPGTGLERARDAAGHTWARAFSGRRCPAAIRLH